MDLCTTYDNFQLHAFWSKKVMTLVREITSHHAKSYATQHDIILKFVNDRFFQGEGAFNREFRVRGKTYPDLIIPVEEAEKGSEIVELRVHTSELKYLRDELRIREKTFSNSDRLFFTYFLQVGSKEKGKIIKDRVCIYYIVFITLLKNTKDIPINELIGEIKMGTKEFTEKLKEESGIDGEKEELLGVDNIIKVVDLERQLSVTVAELDEEKKLREEKEKQLEKKEAELEKERKLRMKAEKENERLKAQLKEKKD